MIVAKSKLNLVPCLMLLQVTVLRTSLQSTRQRRSLLPSTNNICSPKKRPISLPNIVVLPRAPNSTSRTLTNC